MWEDAVCYHEILKPEVPQEVPPAVSLFLPPRPERNEAAVKMERHPSPLENFVWKAESVEAVS